MTFLYLIALAVPLEDEEMAVSPGQSNHPQDEDQENEEVVEEEAAAGVSDATYLLTAPSLPSTAGGEEQEDMDVSLNAGVCTLLRSFSSDIQRNIVVSITVSQILLYKLPLTCDIAEGTNLNQFCM